MHGNIQYRQRITVDWQQCMVGLHDRLVNRKAANVAAINNDCNAIPVGACFFRLRNIAAQLIIWMLSIDLNHRSRRIRTVNSRDSLLAVAVADSSQHRIAIMGK